MNQGCCCCLFRIRSYEIVLISHCSFCLIEVNCTHARARTHKVLHTCFQYHFYFIQFQQYAMPCHAMNPYSQVELKIECEQMDGMRWACRKWRITNYEFMLLLSPLVRSFFHFCSSISFNHFSPSALIFPSDAKIKEISESTKSKKRLAMKRKIEQIKCSLSLSLSLSLARRSLIDFEQGIVQGKIYSTMCDKVNWCEFARILSHFA